jgi:hypothetical protein
MSSRGALIVAALVTFASGSPAYAQTDKIQVVLSTQPSSPIVVTASPTGKFNVVVLERPVSFPPECNSVGNPSHGNPIRSTGVKIEGAVSPAPDGRFRIQLTISVTSEAGCRGVGNLNIPVFANRVYQENADVARGEKIPLTITFKDETLKVEVTLL